jgi:uncharacterized protein YdaL
MSRLFLLLFVMGCAPAPDDIDPDPDPTPTPVVDPWAGFDGSWQPTVGDCSRPPVDDPVHVLLVYDQSGEWGHLGTQYAQAVTNLLGHFVEAVVTAVPTAQYSEGAMSGQDVVVYVGAIWDEVLPAAFKEEVYAFEGRVVWLGANLSKVQDAAGQAAFLDRFGFTSAGTDQSNFDTFFRHVRYRDRVFSKWASVDPDTGAEAFDPVLQLFARSPGADHEILAYIGRTPDDSPGAPYAFSADNWFVVADVPFSFPHRQGRNLVFADLLHTFLGIDHAPSKRALVRLEDIHPALDVGLLNTAFEVLRQERERPFGIALIPQFRDPLGAYSGGEAWEVSMNEGRAADWRDAMEDGMAQGGELVLHGYTHQTGEQINPLNGVSGDDFEFWDAVADAPVADDSPEWFRDRIARAQWLVAQQPGWEPFGFEFPHYRASPLDHAMLPDAYCTTWHGVTNFDYAIDVGEDRFSWADVVRDGAPALPEGGFSVDSDQRSMPQFAPYLLARDIYGQRVLPENLENPTWNLGEPSPWDRTIDDLLATAELNSVLTCGYAAFYFHPFLLSLDDLGDGRTGVEGLEALVHGIEDLGFEFVSPSALEPKRRL